MQTCFFALAGVLPRDEAIAKIKDAIKKTYGKRGETVCEQNFAAVDGALAALARGRGPGRRRRRADATGGRRFPPTRPTSSSGSPRMMIEGKGDLLPVSALPVDGTFPTATARYEKRSIAQEIPIWDPDICIQCGLCALVCPHAAIRTKVFPSRRPWRGAPDGFQSRPWTRQGAARPPADRPGRPRRLHRLRRLRRRLPGRQQGGGQAQGHQHGAQARPPGRASGPTCDFFLDIPELDRTQAEDRHGQGLAAAPAAVRVLGRLRRLRRDAVPEADEPALRRPGDDRQRHRLLVDLRRQPADDALGRQNADGPRARPGPTRCSRTTPSSAWACGWPSTSRRTTPGSCSGGWPRSSATTWSRRSSSRRSDDRGSRSASSGAGSARAQAAARRDRRRPTPRQLLAVADALVRRSVWIVGGDGWAYDIGFGGLDHVLASGRDVNILVLDTEVYSNTGGQASKSTPRGAVAKFASGGKAIGKKDLGMIAVDYGNVYVAQVAMGANPLQTLKAFREAESYRGPSLIIAYSTASPTAST